MSLVSCGVRKGQHPPSLRMLPFKYYHFSSCVSYQSLNSFSITSPFLFRAVSPSSHSTSLRFGLERKKIIIYHYDDRSLRFNLVHHPRRIESFLRTLELFKVSTSKPQHLAAEVTQCQMAASHRQHPVLLMLLRLFSLVARGHMGSRARRPPTLELLNHTHAASHSYLQFNICRVSFRTSGTTNPVLLMLLRLFSLVARGHMGD